ncbi:MAG TPA: hypothetical protein EYO51_10325 [Methylococcaceae bacterium]|nr:hypothetical protein [Methylococcaceae bacterium]HIA46119.1 hypothetical protein [Methylococcaceae bacterium]HIB63499.1 hypothetical protein [Methylococcaceae bacterium]HIO45048.1 hypothetical protein [Methylococcales bacterium]
MIIVPFESLVLINGEFDVEVANQINDLVGADVSNNIGSYSNKYDATDITISTLLANAHKDFYFVDNFLVM